jgi:hypothetical protein
MIRTGRSFPLQIPKITRHFGDKSGSRREGVGRPRSNRSLIAKDDPRAAQDVFRRISRRSRSASASRVPGRVRGTRERLVPGTLLHHRSELWNEPLRRRRARPSQTDRTMCPGKNQNSVASTVCAFRSNQLPYWLEYGTPGHTIHVGFSRDNLIVGIKRGNNLRSLPFNHQLVIGYLANCWVIGSGDWMLADCGGPKTV